MSDKDRKLRLVHSQPGTEASPEERARLDEDVARSAAAGTLGGGRGAEPPDLDDELPEGEPPITEEELREAERIRDAIEAGDEPVSSSLRAAHQPSALAEIDHEALLARALGDVSAPPTRVERVAAERLRTALQTPAAADVASEDASSKDARPSGETSGAPVGARPVTGAGASAAEAARIAEMLRSAWRPAELPPLRNEALITRALAGAGKRRRRSEIVGAVVGVLALAAGVALMLVQGGGSTSSGPRVPPGTAAVALIPSRSTMDIFDASTPFPRTGEESSRIDRITASRSADLRANRYAQWGVR